MLSADNLAEHVGNLPLVDVSTVLLGQLVVLAPKTHARRSVPMGSHGILPSIYNLRGSKCGGLHLHPLVPPAGRSLLARQSQFNLLEGVAGLLRLQHLVGEVAANLHGLTEGDEGIQPDARIGSSAQHGDEGLLSDHAGLFAGQGQLCKGNEQIRPGDPHLVELLHDVHAHPPVDRPPLVCDLRNQLLGLDHEDLGGVVDVRGGKGGDPSDHHK
mmetsp:Transcript_55998/g.122698  ORF Transcript_55998/g.122698 Transcript_55998/m.122698 type:complete len:214 (+) Transcript_55998:1115-1756(+)